MPAMVQITLWPWVIFIAGVLVFLALDLGWFNRHARAIPFKEALGWTLFWFTLAFLFAGGLWLTESKKAALEFFTGYFIELSLSMDNVLVISMIFAAFQIPSLYQHRVLFWGIFGALLMRGCLIWLGISLMLHFEWIFYVFGIFLFLTGARMALGREESLNPQQSFATLLARKFFRVSNELDGQKFFTRVAGRRILTPLFLVLLLVETADLIFAFDSMPAIFGVTRAPFIAFTSNVFAILGLRSLYFVLAGAVGMFRHLKIGLAVVLAFIGAKMIIQPHSETPFFWQREIPVVIALAVVVSIIVISMLASLIAARKEAGGSRREA